MFHIVSIICWLYTVSTQGHKNSSIYLTLFIVVRAINCSIWEAGGFPGGTSGKEPICPNRPMKFRSLGQGARLEEGRTTHSSILAWRIPWTEEPGGLQIIGLQSQTRLKLLSIHDGGSTKFNSFKLSSNILYKLLGSHLSSACPWS